MEKYYECRKCKKSTYSTPNLNDWLRLECRSLQLRIIYEEKHIKTLTKSELTKAVKKLREKCNKIFEEEVSESDLSDHISGDDNELEYLPPTPIQKNPVKRKIFTSDARKEIQSASSIERESEKDSEIDIGEKDDNSIEQAIDRDSEALVRDGDECDSSHETTPQKAKKARKTHSTRHNFRKYYKGSKR